MRFEVSETAIYRWLKQAAAGILEPLKPGAKPVPTKLTPADLEMIRVAVQLEPGVTLAALVERLANQGTRVVESTVSRAAQDGAASKKSHYQQASNTGPMSYRVARRFAVPRPWQAPVSNPQSCPRFQR